MEASAERPETVTSATTLLIRVNHGLRPVEGHALRIRLHRAKLIAVPDRSFVDTVMGKVSLLFCSIFTCMFRGGGGCILDLKSGDGALDGHLGLQVELPHVCRGHDVLRLNVLEDGAGWRSRVTLTVSVPSSTW